MEKNKIAGIWSGHDCSFAVLNEGKPELQFEYERHLRLKEPPGDSVELLFKNVKKINDIEIIATCYPPRYIEKYPESLQNLKNTNIPLISIGHHCSHAANVFYSSNFDEAMIFTLDGGGFEYQTNSLWHNGFVNDVIETAHTVYYGKGNQIHKLAVFPANTINLGGIWTRCTRYIFRLNSGFPRGHQAGTVMSDASFGDPLKYKDDFYKMFSSDILAASAKPAGQGDGTAKPDDPIHPYLDKWVKIADSSLEEKLNLAAGLQYAFELYTRKLFQRHFDTFGKPKNLCLVGGVALNSVMVGKLYNWFPFIENIYIPPAPYDAGLCIGAAQFAWHQILDKPRINWDKNFPPYLGVEYNREDVISTLEKYKDRIVYKETSDEEVITFLKQSKIISIFNGRAESGRRALGNRSILANPMDPDIKQKVNQQVKHRNPRRPFAPSVLREEVSNWFVKDIESPYMSIVIPFKEEKKHLVPGVVHVDGTARLQTVEEKDNLWYYNFIKKWFIRTNIPMILNTSFNDSEPIVDCPEDAIKCFLKTEIDYLYFPKYQILISK